VSLIRNRQASALHNTRTTLSIMAEKGKDISAAQYAYEAMWSEADRAFIARVKEFPSLEAHGDSRGSSIRALRSVIAAVLKDLVESGEEIPAQAAVKKRDQE
jgi:predicted RNase H-like HicB family nuclease